MSEQAPAEPSTLQHVLTFLGIMLAVGVIFYCSYQP